MWYFVLICVVLATAVLRGGQPLHEPTSADLYKDFAHFLVASLLTAAWIKKNMFYWALATGLICVELYYSAPLITKALGL